MRRSVAVAALVAALLATVAPAASRARADDDAMQRIELVLDRPDHEGAVERTVAARGGRVVGRAPGVLLVDVPIPHGRVIETLRIPHAYPREPVPVAIRPGGPTERAPDEPGRERPGPRLGAGAPAPDDLIGADAWHSAGLTGQGVRIGVIDFFDTAYWNVDLHGPLPVAGATARCLDDGRDCISEFFDGDDRGGEDHGVAVVEVLRTVAPDAEIFLGQATSIADYDRLVTWFAERGVQIISRSLGSRYDGPGDGRGPLDDVVGRAGDLGITWVNSGGNNGQGRYYRHRVRIIGDRVAFGPSGDDTYLRFNGCVNLGGVRWAGDWDLPAADRTDYDVFLRDAPTGSPGAGFEVAASTDRQQLGAPPIEGFAAPVCPSGSNRSLYLEVRLAAGNPVGDVLEITDYGQGIAQHTQTASSGAVPVVDHRSPSVVSVGAIEPPGAPEVAPYSSQGPTNDGRIVPTLVSVSGFSNSVFGSFSGTSAAAPVVAGAGALLLDADLAVPGYFLGDLLRNATTDAGPEGPDHAFGTGVLSIGAPPPGPLTPAPSQFVPLDVPARVLDTRPETAIGPPDLTGELWRGEILDLPIANAVGAAASDVTAVAVNVISVDPDRPSHVQLLPTRSAALGGFSNLNIDRAGQTRANMAVVPIGEGGAISIHSIAEGHIVVDLLGWFSRSPDAAGRFVPDDAGVRVLDTRLAPPALGSGEVLSVPLPPGVAVDEISALAVTVTATAATADGWVQAIPSGRRDVVGTTSTLNIAAGDTVANAAIVPVGPAGIELTGFFLGGGSADVVVDVTGWFTHSTDSSGGRFVPIVPARAYDSRLTSAGLVDGQRVVVDAGAVGVPTAASSVVWNVTVAGATRPGHATGSAADGPTTETSLLNWTMPGTTRAAAAFTAVDAARAAFAVDDGPVGGPSPIGHLVVDAFGYFD